MHARRLAFRCYRSASRSKWMRSSRSSHRPRSADPLDPGPTGFAHRGLHGPGIPENSLAAFQAALDAGAGIECDVRLSGDDAVVVIHDSDLVRLCEVPLITERTPAALLLGQRLLDTDHPIPRLSDLLELVGTRAPSLIELKTRSGNAGRLTAAVVDDLARHDGPVGVMSFNPMVAAWLARHRPHHRRGLVLSGRDYPLARWIKMLIARPHFLAVKASEIDCPWVRRARRRMPVYCWTVRTPAERINAAPYADALVWEADGRG